MKLFNFSKKSQVFAVKSDEKKSLFTEQALTNIIMTFQDPDEIVNKIGGRGVLDRLYLDPEIMTATDTRFETLYSKPWRLEGGKVTVNKFIYEQIEKHFEKILYTSFNSLKTGYRVAEAVYKIEDNKIILNQFIEKPSDWFLPYNDNTLRFSPRYIGTNKTDNPLDERKFFYVVRNQTHNNPRGEAVYSRLWYYFIYKTQGWKSWLDYLDQYGKPFFVGETMAGIDPDSGKSFVTLLKEALSNARDGGVIAVNEGTKIEMLNGQAANNNGYQTLDEVINKVITKLILGQTLTSSNEGGGSNALGNVHNEVKNDRVMADSRYATKLFNQVIKALFKLNKFSGEIPVFKYEAEQDLGIDRAARDLTLSQIGIKFEKQYFVDNYELKEEDFELLLNETADNSQNSFTFSESDEVAKAKKKSKELVKLQDNVLGNLASDDEKFMYAVQQVIKTSKSKDECLKGLQELASKREDSDFVESLHAGVFQAALMGKINGRNKK